MRLSDDLHLETESMSVDGERKAIRLILQQLVDEGEEWARNASKAAEAAKRAATMRFGPLSVQTLQSEFQKKRDSGDFGQAAVYLVPPPKESNVPTVLWCTWNFRGAEAYVKYYLGMWLKADRFIAYRFEPPERGDHHNYFHSQPCRSLGRREDEVLGALPIPVSAPTWPLTADSSVELLLCVVLGVRGMAGLQDLEKSLMHKPEARRNRNLTDALGRVLERGHGGAVPAEEAVGEQGK